MNKKVLILIILFLPIIIAGIWFLSISGDNFTKANVSSVELTLPDGTKNEYHKDADKEFFIEFKKNIVSIEDQEYDPDVYTLYELVFKRVKGDVTYFLCLSADVKNCLAYDSNGNWYRIDKEYAKRFLALYNSSSLYQNSEVPVLLFTSSEVITEHKANEASWYYLQSDESYTEVKVESIPTAETDIFVVAGEGFEFGFSIEPDWYDVKIYDGETMVYDGLINSVTEFSNEFEKRERAVITAEWHEDTNRLYHGRAVYDFYFDYDIKAEYAISKTSAKCGEVVYIHVTNVDNETLEATSDIRSAEALSLHTYGEGKLIMLPIPFDTAPGEYKVSVKSEKTNLVIPVTVEEKTFSTEEIQFSGLVTAEKYNDATLKFVDEISSAFKIETSEHFWMDGMLLPVEKYIEGVQQYWVSAPRYGEFQKVNGTEIAARSIGSHYITNTAPIRCSAQGTVVFSGVTSLYGNTIIVEHGFGMKTVYGQLDALNYQVGESIAMGDVIGNMSVSEFSVYTGDFFFGMCLNGVFVNPANFLADDPISPESPVMSQPIEFLKGLITEQIPEQPIEQPIEQ